MSESNGYMTAAALFAGPPKRQYADVMVQGRKFRLRSLTAAELNSVDAEHVAALASGDKSGAKRALSTLPARRIAQVCCDGNGDRIFNDDDVTRILELPSALVAELASACDSHLSLSTDLEDVEKN